MIFVCDVCFTKVNRYERLELQILVHISYVISTK